jgi:ribonuclease Z
LEITFFGTGSATPHLERHPSSCLVNLGNESILIDCGEGTQYRLLQHKIKHTRIRTICITHLHGDHYFGLIGFLSSLNLNQRKEPMRIFAPAQLEQIIRLQFEASETKIGFPLSFILVDTSISNEIFNNEAFSITTLPLIHRVPCTGFLIRTIESKRKILKDLLPQDFPIPYFKILQNGSDVEDELSGKVYKNQDYTTKGKATKSFAYCSDTKFNRKLVPMLQNVDLLYHEATFTKELNERAEKTQHSTAEQAARIAKEADVKKLLIAHFSSRYKVLEPFLKEAKEVFPNTELVIQAFKYII